MLLKLLLLLIIRKFVLVLFPCSCWLFRFRFCVQFFCFGFLVFFWCALFCVCFWGVKARLRSLFLMHRFRWCGRFFYLCRWLFFRLKSCFFARCKAYKQRSDTDLFLCSFSRTLFWATLCGAAACQLLGCGGCGCVPFLLRPFIFSM